MKGKQIEVSRICRAQAPEGSLINGQVTDEVAFNDFLMDFWDQNKLPTKDVTLVLGSAQSVTRLIEVPQMPYKKMMEYLPREFADVERTKERVYGYVELSQEGKMRKVLATMVDRDFLESHVQRTKTLGFRLKAIVMATVSEIQTLNRMDYLKERTAIIQMLDGMSVLNILYVNGHYYQFSRNRIFGERGTPGFGVECARTISNQQQFLKTQQSEENVTHIYMGGEFEKEDFEVCRDSILQMDQELEVEEVYHDKASLIHFPEESAAGAFGKFVTVIGGLLPVKDHSNLLYQYRHSPEQQAKRKALFRYLAPVAVVVMLLSLFSVYQAYTWFARVAVVNEQLDYMGNQEVISRVAEYDSLLADNEMLSRRLGVITKTQENLNSYPQYTSQVKQSIRECANGLAEVTIKGFEEELGTVEIEASAQDAERIHQFVYLLEERQDIFNEIFYDGFQFDDRSGTWKTSINCYLTAADGEVTP